MIFNTIFDHIYVINLKDSIERKTHIENEFKRVGIEKYDFFEATPYDSDEVKNLMNTNFVKKFPNCFRCGLNRCNCENNYLTPYQIGNWCSFLNIFRDILKNKYNFVLICEDDIVFSHQYNRIINKLLSKESFKYYNINNNQPLLIRMGTAFNPDNHNSSANPIFLKNFSLCNPCFAINKEMAFIYLKYLKIIDYHSDVYFHQKIPKNIKGIQYFTMYPYPIYELSFVKSKQKFESLIRPKNAFRRIEYKEFLFLSSNIYLNNFIKKFVKILNLDIHYDKIGYNGNIDSFLFLKETDKNKYYFENKILFYDEDDININILKNNINSIYYQNFLKKINELYDLSVDKEIFPETNINKNTENLEICSKINIDDNIQLIYDKYMEILNKESIIKININNSVEINKYTKSNLLNNIINEYNKLKNNNISL
jgi:GR25 family glycosyltransferase involved in LPS biosynthesis